MALVHLGALSRGHLDTPRSHVVGDAREPSFAKARPYGNHEKTTLCVG